MKLETSASWAMIDMHDVQKSLSISNSAARYPTSPYCRVARDLASSSDRRLLHESAQGPYHELFLDLGTHGPKGSSCINSINHCSKGCTLMQSCDRPRLAAASSVWPKDRTPVVEDERRQGSARVTSAEGGARGRGIRELLATRRRRRTRRISTRRPLAAR